MSKQKRKQKQKDLFSERLGKNLKMAREDMGLSQFEVGSPLGLNQQQVSYIEAGNNCKVNIYPALAEELSLTMEELIIYHKRKKED